MSWHCLLLRAASSQQANQAQRHNAICVGVWVGGGWGWHKRVRRLLFANLQGCVHCCVLSCRTRRSSSSTHRLVQGPHRCKKTPMPEWTACSAHPATPEDSPPVLPHTSLLCCSTTLHLQSASSHPLLVEPAVLVGAFFLRRQAAVVLQGGILLFCSDLIWRVILWVRAYLVGLR